jgi:cell division protein FtsB
LPLQDDLQSAAQQLATLRAQQAALMAQMEELRATVARRGAALDGAKKDV